LPGFERAVLEGYLSGLRDAGWTGDATLVYAVYAAIGALRFGLLAAPVLNLALDEARHETLEARYGRPIAATITRRAAVVRRALDLARGLATNSAQSLQRGLDIPGPTLARWSHRLHI
jgi:hypothetical protein